MNYFVEGLQGSGKSTLARMIAEKKPEYVLKQEGDYSPVELAWCAYLNEDQYQEIVFQYLQVLLLQAKHRIWHESKHRHRCDLTIRVRVPI